jgi:GTP-binding protein
VNLGASDEQLDFPIVYASALRGFAGLDPNEVAEDMTPLFETIVNSVAAPDVNLEGPFQMQISQLDYSSYVGAIGIGRISRGKVRPNMNITVIDHEGKTRNGKVLQVLGYLGLERKAEEEASAGDIVAITGIDNLRISDTLCDPTKVEALPALTVDEPTVTMTLQVNTSPFAGKDGKYLTSRQILARLEQELIHNVALRVDNTEDPDKFKCAGRGELHLSILIETMRREGFELAVSRPQVIIKEVDGVRTEPYESVTVDIEEQHQGCIMEALAERKGKIKNMVPDGKGRIRLDYMMPTRGLIGFHTEFLTQTSGTGLMYHVFDHFGPVVEQDLGARRSGALISNAHGKATGYSLWNLEDRGKLCIGPQTDVYEGMIVGFHTRSNDLVVNVIRPKQLTNVRASGTDENIMLTPPLKLTLEQALEYINDDELVEVTPLNLRLRKRFLKEHERKRGGRI